MAFNKKTEREKIMITQKQSRAPVNVRLLVALNRLLNRLFYYLDKLQRRTQKKVVAREWGDLLGLSKFQLNLIKAEWAGDLQRNILSENGTKDRSDQ
jgi:hypothetical protein